MEYVQCGSQELRGGVRGGEGKWAGVAWAAFLALLRGLSAVGAQGGDQ